jgi:hypothetical protein
LAQYAQRRLFFANAGAAKKPWTQNAPSYFKSIHAV